MTSGKADRVPDYLDHLILAIDRAMAYVSGMSVEAFRADTRTQDAVIRSIEIIGEAAHRVRRMDPAFAATHADIPWEQMYGMRNRIVHDYFEIDLDVVWQTVITDLPALRAKIFPLRASIAPNPRG
jgi:uncharacterized protein with HEPN domain